MPDTQKSDHSVSTKRQRIAQLSAQYTQRSFVSLSHHIDMEWMREAWRRTRKDGAAGVDNQTAEMYEQGLEDNLQSLLERFHTGVYRAPPVKRVYIVKADGKSRRPIGIPTLEDKVLQRAVVMLLEPIYEHDFLDCSYGYRPKRSAHMALERLWSGLLGMAGGWVLEMDIKSFFDALDKEALRRMLDKRIKDGVIRRTIDKWLKAGVMDGGELSYLASGSPQGGVISPLLANIYLHLLDRIWERNRMEARFGARLVRYANDLVICCGGKPDKPMRVLQAVLSRLGLTLNQQKTHVVDAREESFDFLGFSFRVRINRDSGKHYPHIEPSKKSLQRFRTKCKGLTDRRLTPMPLPQLVARLNRVIQGWCGYFHYRNSTRAFAKVRFFVEERVRTHLRRRYKVGSREHAYKRFPTAYLYEVVGC